MRKVASNLLLKENVAHVYFLCKQVDGYRVVKEIAESNKQQISTFYQNGYGILLSEQDSILESVEQAIKNMSGKTCIDEFASDYDAKKHLIEESASFIGQSAIPICEIEKAGESYKAFKEYLEDNKDILQAFVLCLFD